MANRVYPKYKAAAMSAGANHDLLAGNVKLVLIDQDAYTYADTHEFLSDIPAGARVSISGALTGKSVGADAAFKCANSRFEAVTGLAVECVACFVDSGIPSTSRLVAFIDTGITGLPVTPDGASYNVLIPAVGLFIL